MTNKQARAHRKRRISTCAPSKPSNRCAFKKKATNKQPRTKERKKEKCEQITTILFLINDEIRLSCANSQGVSCDGNDVERCKASLLLTSKCDTLASANIFLLFFSISFVRFRLPPEKPLWTAQISAHKQLANIFTPVEKCEFYEF